MNKRNTIAAICAAFIVSGVAAAQCTDPWVSQAVREVLNRPAQGSGNSGECAIANYGGGHWSSYPDLKAKVMARFGVRAAVPVPVAPPRYAPAPQPVYAPVIRPGAGIVAAGGGNIIAAGGGNIVAAGGGNIIAAGGGNFRVRGEEDVKLAKQGDPQAQFRAGLAYANGQGVGKDDVEAYKWFSLASDAGVKEAAEERKALKAKLTRDQIKTATHAAEQFKPITE